MLGDIGDSMDPMFSLVGLLIAEAAVVVVFLGSWRLVVRSLGVPWIRCCYEG
jgi:hypothetical protein